MTKVRQFLKIFFFLFYITYKRRTKWKISAFSLRFLRSMAQKYGEQLIFWKNYCSKKTLHWSQILPAHQGHLPLHYCRCPKQCWTSFFMSVFSCTSVAAPIFWISYKRWPFVVLLSLEKSYKSLGNTWTRTHHHTFPSLPFHWVTHGSSEPYIFITSQKDTKENYFRKWQE